MRVKNIQIEVEDNETALGIIILTLEDKIKTLEEKTERLESSLNEILEYLAKESKTMTQECPFDFEDENGFTDYRENEPCLEEGVDETFEIIKCPVCECPEERGSMYEHIRHYHPDEDDYLRAYL